MTGVHVCFLESRSLQEALGLLKVDMHCLDLLHGGSELRVLRVPICDFSEDIPDLLEHGPRPEQDGEPPPGFEDP